MICPWLATGLTRTQRQVDAQCERENCAMFDARFLRCSVTTLNDISEILAESVFGGSATKEKE